MKGVTGYQLTIIVTIIVAIIVIALVWVFLKMGTEGFTEIFGKVVTEFTEAISGILGPWANIFMPGL